MKRLTIGLALCAVMSTAGAASAELYYGFHVGITNAPPPPTIVYRDPPEVIVVPGTTVYVADPGDNDCDLFRVGGLWYASRGGYWYKARSHRGPFVVTDARRVPRAIFNAPARYWRHHPHGGPPGLTKKHGSKGGKHAHKGHGKGHGKSKGQGKVHTAWDD
jgi:hypothetical protein